jgi:hypothetical protein
MSDGSYDKSDNVAICKNLNRYKDKIPVQNEGDYKNLNGSDDGLQHSESLGLRILSTAQNSKNYETQRFGNWFCFRL